jgi:DnaD/phage-associated family protein
MIEGKNITFSGFKEGKTSFTPIPAQFFSELLPQINDSAELKVTLYAFWFLNRMEGNVRYITRTDFKNDPVFLAGLGDGDASDSQLDHGLALAVERGTLLVLPQPDEAIYFLNTQRSRAALEAAANGKWTPDTSHRQPPQIGEEKPNIFKLYESNIGPLTPMIADLLKEAEDEYPPEWVEDAFRIAVENNVRRWRYIAAILQSWQQEGRDDQNRRNPEEDRRRYIEGKFAAYIKH